jgi:hypothetical protein
MFFGILQRADSGRFQLERSRARNDVGD